MPKRKIVTVTVDDAKPGTLEPIGPDRFQFIAPVAFGKQFSFPDPVILRGFEEVGFSDEVGHFGTTIDLKNGECIVVFERD